MWWLSNIKFCCHLSTLHIVYYSSCWLRRLHKCESIQLLYPLHFVLCSFTVWLTKTWKESSHTFWILNFFSQLLSGTQFWEFFTVSESRSNVSKQMIIGGILMLSYYTPNIFYLIIYKIIIRWFKLEDYLFNWLFRYRN